MKRTTAYSIPACSLVGAVLLLVSAAETPAQEAENAFVPPRGIPLPDWGRVNPVTLPPPARPANWAASPQPGFYYVKSSHPSSTDLDNPLGNPDRPRKTVPSELPVGAYVEIADCDSNVSFDGLKGTAEAPIWLVGSGEALVQPDDTGAAIGFVACEYIIVHGLTLDGSAVPISRGSAAWAISSNCHHIAIRNCVVRNQPAPAYNPDRFSSGGAGAWYSGLSSIVARDGPVNDIVVFGCDYTGNAGGQTLDYESGRHCIIASGRTQGRHAVENVWILNNTMHDNPEDGVQLGESSNNADRTLCRNFFIGGNRITNNGENAIDLKACERVIVSGNVLSGYRKTHYRSGAVSGSDGTACVLNNDGGGPLETWWLFNTIRDSRVAWRNQSAGGDHYFVGNLVCDLKTADGEGEPTSTGKSGGVAYWQNSGANAFFANNTLCLVHGGIYLFNVGRTGVYGNIVYDVADHKAGWPININNADEVRVAGNLRFDPDGPVRRDAVGDTDVTDLNPRFAGTDLAVPETFILQSESPILKVSPPLSPFESLFLAAWGRPVELEFDRTAEPPGATISIPDGSGGLNPPSGLDAEPE